MGPCPFFKEEISHQERPVNTGSMGAAPLLVTKKPWCSHKHSARPKPQRTDLLGEHERLHCGGAIESCQVPKAVRLDIR